MMDATDELRKLLTERGVEWRSDSEDVTFWNDAADIAVASECWDGRLWVSTRLTPEQAVNATLGAWTCKPEKEHLDSYSDLTVTVCSNCRVAIDDLEDCHYCPNCGAKVVE